MPKILSTNNVEVFLNKPIREMGEYRSNFIFRLYKIDNKWKNFRDLMGNNPFSKFSYFAVDESALVK
jgi:hypothetical protein